MALLLLFPPIFPNLWCYLKYEFCNNLIFDAKIYLFTLILFVFSILLPRLERIKFQDLQIEFNQAPDLKNIPTIQEADLFILDNDINTKTEPGTTTESKTRTINEIINRL